MSKRKKERKKWRRTKEKRSHEIREALGIIRFHNFINTTERVEKKINVRK